MATKRRKMHKKQRFWPGLNREIREPHEIRWPQKGTRSAKPNYLDRMNRIFRILGPRKYDRLKNSCRFWATGVASPDRLQIREMEKLWTRQIMF
jgi:hypothetical protein